MPADCFAQRIESTIGTGIPDVIVISESLGTFWIELKGEGGRMRPTQLAWQNIAHRHGAKIFHIYKKREGWLVISFAPDCETSAFVKKAGDVWAQIASWIS